MRWLAFGFLFTWGFSKLPCPGRGGAGGGDVSGRSPPGGRCLAGLRSPEAWQQAWVALARPVCEGCAGSWAFPSERRCFSLWWLGQSCSLLCILSSSPEAAVMEGESCSQ